MRLVAFDDLQLPAAGLGNACGRRGSFIASVGEDAFDEGNRRRVRRSRSSRADKVHNVPNFQDCRLPLDRGRNEAMTEDDGLKAMGKVIQIEAGSGIISVRWCVGRLKKP
jgi:hypothetical protein